ncbi:Wzz/FepE/Etk N-terminal domain-containing protein, partial [Bacteroidota bacterium]
MAENKGNENIDIKFNKEIDLIALLKIVWNGRKTLFISLIVFSFLGLFVAIFSEEEYSVSTTMVPQLNNSSSRMGGLSSLASLAGFNMDMSSGSNELSPILYPQIVGSTTFLTEIMNANYSFDELDEKINLFDYYTNYYNPGVLGIVKKYTIGLPGLILSS